MNWYWVSYNWFNKKYAKENRKNPTKWESLVWHMILKNKKLWFKFVRQRMIWKYIVDFYCSKLKLVIEIDWESHNYKYEYDKERVSFLKSLWLFVLVYSDNDVLKNLDWVLEDIQYNILQLKNNLT